LPLLPRAAILKTQVGPAYTLRVGSAYTLSSSAVAGYYDDLGIGLIVLGFGQYF
jgi:hypothetical protein